MCYVFISVNLFDVQPNLDRPLNQNPHLSGEVLINGYWTLTVSSISPGQQYE